MRVISLSVIFLLLMVHGRIVMAQPDTTSDASGQKVKTGWTFGALPTIAYDADMGFQYGGLVNFFNYGDGSTYPEYRHSFIVEISRFTKGSGVNQFFYDSKYLLPDNIRITADLSYFTDKALDFYGFNGYEATYLPVFAYENEDEYISRMFYRHERKMLRILTDLQGNISGNWNWLAGFARLDFDIAGVDIDKINKGKDEADKLPEVPLLFDHFINWGIIPEDEKHGGAGNFIRLGLIYDSRDFEASPNKGIWTEVLVMAAPKFLFNKDFACTKLAVTHRQYIPIVFNKLTFAYRLGYQTTIGGHTPFYLQPYMINSFSTSTKPDGLGGGRTLRGILRNRIVGDGIAYGNLELRWKFYRTLLFNQNIYLGLTGFMDAGQVVRSIENKVNSNAPHIPNPHFNYGSESLHIAYGGGLRIGINENFIVAMDFGMAHDERDGNNGFYIGISNLF